MATTRKNLYEDAGTAQYSTAGLGSREEVENAVANAYYTPSQSVNEAASALKAMQQNRPAQYQSAYQSRIDSLLGDLSNRGSFDYSYLQDPLYRQYAQVYTQNAHNASADAAAQAAALTGGYGSSYAVSAAQQAYQQQIGALNSAIPTLYALALDTYNAEGDALVTQLDQLNTQEQNAQSLYDKQLADYYTQLNQLGDAYNTAVSQGYTQYQNYLSQLNTLRGYYSEQEQAAASQKQQSFNNIITVLGLIGDAVQLAITGTTGLGSLAGSLLNTGYNIYSGNRQYEADRADTAWEQQMQQLQYQDSQAQQQYKNTQAEREYQDALAQQKFENDVTSQKLAIAKGEWALKQSQAAQSAARASARASSSGSSSGSSRSSTGTSSRSTGTKTSGSGVSSGTSGGTGITVVPFAAARLRSQGKSDLEISSALTAQGYTSAQVKQILAKMNQ